MESLGDIYAVLLHNDQLRRAWLQLDDHPEPPRKRSRLRRLIGSALRAVATRLEPVRHPAAMTPEPRHHLLRLLSREAAPYAEGR